MLYNLKKGKKSLLMFIKCFKKVWLKMDLWPGGKDDETAQKDLEFVPPVSPSMLKMSDFY